MRTFALAILTSITLAPMLAKADEWPPLPDKGFISGRAATFEDVKNGDALFVVAIDGRSIGRPIDVRIPQYVFIKNTTKTKGILVQAEEANGIRAYGIRALDGQDTVVTESEIEFLGASPVN